MKIAADVLVVEGKLDAEFVCLLWFGSGHSTHCKTTPPSKEAANCPTFSTECTFIRSMVPKSVSIECNSRKVISFMMSREKYTANKKPSAAFQRKAAEATIPAQL